MILITNESCTRLTQRNLKLINNTNLQINISKTLYNNNNNDNKDEIFVTQCSSSNRRRGLKKFRVRPLTEKLSVPLRLCEIGRQRLHRNILTLSIYKWDWILKIRRRGPEAEGK